MGQEKITLEYFILALLIKEMFEYQNTNIVVFLSSCL